MDQKRKKILMSIGGVALLIALYFWYEHIMYVETDNAQIEAHSVLIAAKISGYVSAVNVNDGQKVKKGEVLASLDERDYQNTFNQAKGELTSIQARMNDAERNYARIRQLYTTGAVSQQQYDSAGTVYSEVKAKYDSVSSQVSQAELNLENTKVRAPSDGVIARRSVEVGQLASPGVPLFGFVDGSTRWVVANYKETDIEKIKIGALVDISVDAVSKKVFVGKVNSLSAATGATFTLLPPDNATGNFTKVVQRVPVKITFENLNEEDIEILRAGLSVISKVHQH